MSFGPTGPFHFKAPKESDGKKENFEEFSFKFESYMSLVNPGLTAAMSSIEANLASPMAKARFNDED